MNKKLNILYLDFDDIKNPLLGAGQARATYEVGKILAERGHVVKVISGRYPGYKDRVDDGIFYKHIGIGTKNIRINNVFYILSIPFALRRAKADIVIECFTAPITTLLSPLWTKTPVVAIPTSFEAERFSKQYHIPFHIIQNNSLRFYKFFLPYSKFFDKKFKTYNPKVLSEVIPQGADEEMFKIKRVKPEHILFLGRLDIGQKGIDLLLESYKKAEKLISYPLIIAGSGPDGVKVSLIIKHLGLENKVRMVGWADSKLKKELLKKSAFVVIPSRHEGFCIWALESLAAGVPIICFDIPGLSWLPNGVAKKVKAFDVEELTRTLIQANKYFSSHISKVCRQTALKYSWKKVARKYETFFNHILTHDNLRHISGKTKYEN